MPSTLLREAVAAVAPRLAQRPRVGLILGTGLGELAREVNVQAEVPYAAIPHFPRSTAMAHRGVLLAGTMAEVPLIVMAGRCHLYEGYSRETIAFPVQVMHALGIELLIITNAAGGLHPRFAIGDVMAIDDHINLMFPRETSANGDCRLLIADCRMQGALPPICNLQSTICNRLYDRSLIEHSLAIARARGIALHRGVYVGVTGPNYETQAEYRAFRRLGGDVVGMSTIPEVLCAAALDLRVLALSTVTNVARPDAPQVVTPEDVVAMAGRAEPKVRAIVSGIVGSLAR